MATSKRQSLFPIREGEDETEELNGRGAYGHSAGGTQGSLLSSWDLPG